jgi:glucose-1-phosphate thymidylyltransferase
MKAIILAAGYATRLYPLTMNQPKALLPLAGKPILDYIVEKIEEVPAIDEILLITNTKFYPNFCTWAENKKGGLPVSVFDDGTDSDETKLGAIGDLQFLIDKVGIDDDILLMASDNYFEFSLKDFYDFYLEKGAESICAKRIEVDLNENGGKLLIDYTVEVEQSISSRNTYELIIEPIR